MLSWIVWLNWIASNRNVFWQLNRTSTLKLYLHLTELLHITVWIVWEMFLTNCVLNWIVLNRTDYLHKNGFGVK